MKRSANIFLSCLLAVSILFGYAGIPVYRMVCGTEGKTIVSVTDLKDACKHDQPGPGRKSCCMPVEREADSCCDYSSDLLQLHELPLLKESRQSTGHLLTAIGVLFTMTAAGDLHSPPNLVPAGQFHPPDKPRRSFQSLTGTFRI